MQMLRKTSFSGLSPFNLLQDVAARWHSTYLMLARLQEQRLAFREVASIAKIGNESPFTSAQWNIIMSHIIFVLKSFKDVTDTLRTATATLVKGHSCSWPA